MPRVRYKVTYADETFDLCYNVNEVGKCIKRNTAIVREVLKGNGYYEDIKIEKLSDSFSLTIPQIDDILEFEGVQCKVMHVYDKTFSVSSIKGTGVVRIKDMQLASPLSFGSIGSSMKIRKF